MARIQYESVKLEREPVKAPDPPAMPAASVGFDRKAYQKAYMRDYMREWRRRQKEQPK